MDVTTEPSVVIGVLPAGLHQNVAVRVLRSAVGPANVTCVGDLIAVSRSSADLVRESLRLYCAVKAAQVAGYRTWLETAGSDLCASTLDRWSSAQLESEHATALLALLGEPGAHGSLVSPPSEASLSVRQGLNSCVARSAHGSFDPAFVGPLSPTGSGVEGATRSGAAGLSVRTRPGSHPEGKESVL